MTLFPRWTAVRMVLRIMKNSFACPFTLKKGGYILLEAGIDQARHISEVFAGRGLSALEIRPDLAGTERCVILKNELHFTFFSV